MEFSGVSFPEAPGLIVFSDPLLFSRLQGSAKIRSDPKIRSDLKNKSAGAFGIYGV